MHPERVNRKWRTGAFGGGTVLPILKPQPRLPVPIFSSKIQYALETLNPVDMLEIAKKKNQFAFR